MCESSGMKNREAERDEGPAECHIVVIDYTNWKGDRRSREIHPLRIFFGESEYHEDAQWFLEGIDVGTGEIRNFAMKDVHSWKEWEPTE